jgi:serine/threonine protein kinase/tetratricopeptide (TPR) repeat protein
MIGQTVGHYQIAEKLGEGGMGIVYKARDTKLDRDVALKFLPPRLTANHSDRSRFLQEARSASALNHPNICTVYYLEEVGEESFIVMEYVDGTTLRDRIPVQSIKDAVSWVATVSEALQEAHAKGIIHRDIKSDNIMINSRGQVKVMDFGLAKIKGSLKLTRSSSTIGTLAYMAPEQLRGEEVDPRSDIFSLGAVLFETLTGTTPFKGEHEAAIMYSVLNEEPEPIEKYRADVPEALSALIRRCLEKDPADRFQHADDLASELRRIAKQSAKVVRPSMEMERPASAGPSTAGLATPQPSSNERPSADTSRPVQQTAQRRRRLAAGITAAIVVPLLAVAGYLLFRSGNDSTSAVSSRRKMLVVIPFENLGAPDQEYFADGVTEEITGKLSGLSGLGVIARTSAMQYKKTTKSMNEIGRELGVGYVLQGTIRWEGGPGGTRRVRVSPALIKVSDGTQIWSESYDAVVSDVFKIQSGIAGEVASAMGVALLKPEQELLQTAATSNSQAYDYYLRGMEYRHRSYLRQDSKIAEEMFRKAVNLDPNFALAHARLAELHFMIYWFFYDHSEKRLAMGKSEVDRAIELDPNLPEGHYALGYYYYWGRLDYEKALVEFRKYADARPNSAEIWLAIGAVQRRQGRFNEATGSMLKACELDPRSTEDAYNLSQTYTLLGRYDESEQWSKRAISLSPEVSPPRLQLLINSILRDGNTRAAREEMKDAEQIFSRETDDLLRNMYVRIEELDGHYDEALRLAAGMALPAEDDQFMYRPRQLIMAGLYRLMGNAATARTYFDSARVILLAKIKEQPGDARLYSSLGIAYAGLGNRDEAIRNGRRGMELLPVSKEAWRGTNRVEAMVKIYLMLGENDLAIKELTELLALPSMVVSKPLLRADPEYSALSNDDRFKQLVSAN